MLCLNRLNSMPRSIRVKIGAALALLILLVFTLAGAGLYAVRLHQQQVRDVAWRVNVLPVASNLSRHVSGLQKVHSQLLGIRETRRFMPPTDGTRLRLENQFTQTLVNLGKSYEEYRLLLVNRVQDIGIEESFEQEFSTVENIRLAIEDLNKTVGQEDWSTTNVGLEQIEFQLDTLQRHTEQLPSYLAAELNWYAKTMQRHSGWLKMTVIICVIISVGLMLLLIRLSFLWIFQPLHVLVEGSRQVASGNYGTRIKLSSNDEIAELAEAMNFMTEQFEEKVRQLEESRRDLDNKIQQKSRELVRSERLASVGFLAAGVAHEINNPLMAISACAESLSRRTSEGYKPPGDTPEDTDHVKRYLTMIQEEAFRCKGITERLLGLARKESTERTKTDFVPIITDMLEMLRQHDTFKKKDVTLDLPKSFEIRVNVQEMKQVVLNLLTNAFQNTDVEGQVLIRLYSQENRAVLSVQDNGTGMDTEVLHNIFEPFFTRQKGGSGTGLGLSITHCIVEEHQGRILAFSEGPGKGSKFVVELPRE